MNILKSLKEDSRRNGIVMTVIVVLAIFGLGFTTAILYLALIDGFCHGFINYIEPWLKKVF